MIKSLLMPLSIAVVSLIARNSSNPEDFDCAMLQVLIDQNGFRRRENSCYLRNPDSLCLNGIVCGNQR
jgi:hypothetical protein